MTASLVGRSQLNVSDSPRDGDAIEFATHVGESIGLVERCSPGGDGSIGVDWGHTFDSRSADLMARIRRGRHSIPEPCASSGADRDVSLREADDLTEVEIERHKDAR